MALVHSEASEALEEVREGHAPTETHYKYTRVSTEGWEGSTVRHNDRGIWLDGQRVTPDNAEEFGYDAKPEGVPSELADVIIRVLDICGYYGIDIEHAMLTKAKYNEGRSHRHGEKAL
jgi:NTP pyrophosphatase (non-canonical NTP hydrolase)